MPVGAFIKTAVTQVGEQAVKVMLITGGLLLLSPSGLEYALIAVVGGGAVAEALSLPLYTSYTALTVTAITAHRTAHNHCQRHHLFFHRRRPPRAAAAAKYSRRRRLGGYRRPSRPFPTRGNGKYMLNSAACCSISLC